MSVKILHLVGARPQFIKAAALHRALKAEAPLVQEVLVHSGQHYDNSLSGQFFTELELPEPTVHLEVGGQAPEEQLKQVKARMEDVLQREKPNLVLVYGDTTTTLGGALAAEAAGLPLAHVEAGMRSGFLGMPEEVNRIETDKRSTFLFCTDGDALENLRKEGLLVPGRVAEVVGDLMKDQANHFASKLGPLSPTTPFALVTIHRNFNTDDPDRLAALLDLLGSWAQGAGITLRFPVHPRTQKAIAALSRQPATTPNGPWLLLEPMGYLDTLRAIREATYVITDSGGVQREAYFLGKPSVVLRGETEWTALQNNGWVHLAGFTPEAFHRALKQAEQPPSGSSDLLGAGDAAPRIVKTLLNHLRDQ